MKKLQSMLPGTLALLLSLIMLFPLYWMFNTSIMPTSEILSLNPPLWPTLSKINFDAYVSILHNTPILRWFANSLNITLWSSAISMGISILAGYSLSRFRTRGQAVMGFFLLVNRMLPGTLIIIPIFIMTNSLHLINNPLAVILTNITAIVPFATWMMKVFFDSIPVELEEAGFVDGCSRLKALVRIILPLTAPGLAATGIYSAVLAWSDFLFARSLLLESSQWTITVGTISFIGQYMVQWSSLMAMGFLSVVPMIVLFFLLEPFFVRGMTSGAVKG